ncbi:MAG: DUF362 domain-containing protein [Thermoleophilia bacterium]
MTTASEVLYIDSHADGRERNLIRYARLLHRLDLKSVINEGDLVAVKLSFGERGNLTYLRPQYVRPVIDEIKRLGGRPFLTDSNTLYAGGRTNSRDHAITALQNGFGYDVTGAPVVIAGGLLGLDYRTVPLAGEHFSEAKIVAEAVDADAIISLSHFKGHMICGCGGTLKNLGMGFGARAGKQMMHSDVHPQVDAAKCDGCARCVKWCPVDAISLVESDGDGPGRKTASIDGGSCIGCGECVTVCFTGAIGISWKSDPAIVQQKMAEYAFAVLQEKKNKFAAINFLLDITPDCDCLGWSDVPIVPNLGIMASNDPVALDTASLDLVNQAHGIAGGALPAESLGAGGDKFGAIHHGIDSTAQLVHAQKLGLGTRLYEIINLAKLDSDQC